MTVWKSSFFDLDIFQILTNARMEVTCVATLRSVETQSEVMDACVPEAIDLRELGFHVWVIITFV